MLCQRGSKFDNVFFIDDGREDRNTTLSGASSAFRSRAEDCPTLISGLVAL